MRLKRFTVIAMTALLGALALATGTAQASAAAPSGQETTAGDVGAMAPCRPVHDAGRDGRTVILWSCDGTGGTRNGYHGQIVNARAGDQVWLESPTGARHVYRTAPGSGNYNTATVGDHGGPWKACIHVPRAGTTCTDRGW